MTASNSSERLSPSSFFTALVFPRTTIRRVAKATSFPVLVLLSSGIGLSNFLSLFTHAKAIQLDAKSVGIALVIGALVGLVSIAATAIAARWIARAFGGQADLATLRAALAWGSAPLLNFSAVYLLVHVGQRSAGIAFPPDVGSGLLAVAMLWALFTSIAMFMEVQGFDVVRAILTYLGSVAIVAICLAMAARIFLWQPFNTPSESLAPNLIAGDHFFVSKFAYGYSRHSFPMSLVPMEGRIFGRQPQRGDVVVHKGRDGRTDYVKRIIGMPGETIALRNGSVFINDTAVPRRRIDDFPMQQNGPVRLVPQFEEILPNGVAVHVLDSEPNGPLDNVSPRQVPAGHYYVLGDNRDNSTDSRLPQQYGFVPFEALIGRADLIFMSISPDGKSRGERALTPVR